MSKIKNHDVQSVNIQTSKGKAFEYIANPSNLSKWTGAFKHADEKSALLVTPSGELKIGIETKTNKELGAIDWYIGIVSKCTSIGGHEMGIDGNKKIKGSKQHIITDTMGLIICLSIHAANIHDSKDAKEVFEKLYELRHDHELMKKIFADGGYQRELGDWLKEKLKLDMEIVKRIGADKWEVLLKRWIVERTFAWLMNFRRLVMDYERTIESVESHIYIAMIILMGKKNN